MKENNEQLYIARCMVDLKFKKFFGRNCILYENCFHTKPHKWINEIIILEKEGDIKENSTDINILKRFVFPCLNKNSSFDKGECECIPVPFEYYIEEILNKEEEK